MIDVNTLTTAQLLQNYNDNSGKPAVLKWKKKVDLLRAALVKLCPDRYLIGDAKAAFEATVDELTAQTGRPVDHTETSSEHNIKASELKRPVSRPKTHNPDADFEKAVKAEHKPKAAKKAKAKKEPSGDRGAIRRYCEEQLLVAKGTDPETKRPLGLPYSTILDHVTRKFPEAETSLNCLRWYATKMNKRTGKEKVVMPVRPKAKTAEAA